MWKGQTVISYKIMSMSLRTSEILKTLKYSTFTARHGEK